MIGFQISRIFMRLWISDKSSIHESMTLRLSYNMAEPCNEWILTLFSVGLQQQYITEVHHFDSHSHAIVQCISMQADNPYDFGNSWISNDCDTRERPEDYHPCVEVEEDLRNLAEEFCSIINNPEGEWRYMIIWAYYALGLVFCTCRTSSIGDYEMGS